MTDLGALYIEHGPAIRRVVYRRVRDWHTAEDVTSETFLRALRGPYQERGTSFAWLYQIASNLVVDHYRRRALEERQTPYPRSSESAEDVAMRRLLARQVWRMVEGFPLAQRRALVLFYQEDMSVEDIAVELGTTPGAVKALLHRALVGVRRGLGGCQPN